MTIDEKILKIYHFKETYITEKQLKAIKLTRLLPVNEILVVNLKTEYLVYGSNYVTTTPGKYLKETIAMVKSLNPEMKHKVTRMSLKRVKARHEQLKEIMKQAS